MQDVLERLGRIDRLDRDRVRHEADAKKLEAALAEADRAVEAASAAFAEAQALLEANRTAERAAQRRIDELRQKWTSAIRILETGAGDPAAAQRQVENCDRLIDEAETAMLEVLEAQDRAKAALERARGAHSAAVEAAGKARAELPPRVAEATGAASGLTGEYDRELAGLPADFRKRYTSLRAAGKWPVAHVRDGSCDGCRMAVPAQNVADLRKGRILECMGCHRWLVLT